MHLAALFDMDGLLIDSERSIMNAWLSAAAQLKVSFSQEQYLTVIGRSAPESDEILAELFGGQLGFEYAREAVLRSLDEALASTGFPLRPGAKKLLSALAARRIPCAVASSSARHEIESRLTKVGVLHHFSSVAGGDEVPRGKPDPAVYLLAAERLGVCPEHCIAFEDSHNGARSALAAGASLAMIPDLLEPTDELVSRSMSILRSLEEVLPHVDRWFSATDPTGSKDP